MKIRLFFIISLLLVVAEIPVFAANTGKQKNDAPQADWQAKYLPNQIIMKFKNQVNISGTSTGMPSTDRILKKTASSKIVPFWPNGRALRKAKSTYGIERIYLIYFEGDLSPKIIADKFKNDPDIEYAEPLPYYHISEIPNDPLFSNQTYLNVVKAPEAWDVVKGQQADVIFAVVDGGTEINHPDIKGNLWLNPNEIPNNGLDDDSNGLIDDIHGWNYANNSNDPTGLAATPINANHGTQTAGIACAVTNNNQGVAGASWNAKLMAINASSATRDTTINSTFGYQGIVYAAMEGANVISLSWGGSDFLQAGQDIINFAVSQGAAIVAAAGNESVSDRFYPAAYDNVLAVGATDNNDKIASFSNFGDWLDVLAPGINIFTVSSSGGYSSFRASGTSFSAPLTAGILALVKARKPDWTGIQIAEQVRVTADNIESINPQLIGLLGNGRINAFKAVSDTILPSIRITAIQYFDDNNDGLIQPGETVAVSPRFVNLLNSTADVNVTLNESDPYITLINSTSMISSIGTLAEAGLNSPFTFQVAESTPRNHTIEFTIEFIAGDYKDQDSFELTVLPDFANTMANNINTSITNKGRIGFADTKNQQEGIGFIFNTSSNLLFEGAIIAGTGPNNIVNAARGELQNGDLNYEDDFIVANDGEIQVKIPGVVSDVETSTKFTDQNAQKPLHLKITQETFAWNTTPYQNFIIFRYLIENLANSPLSNFHFGLFFDWDIDGETYATNVAEYDLSHRLGYAYDTSTAGPKVYTGVSLLSDGKLSYRAIYNNENASANQSWGIYDGFSKAEKWQAISGGTTFSEAGPEDISNVMAAGPFVIPSQQAIEVTFALLAGDNLQSLQVSVDSARSLYKRIIPTPDIFVPPTTLELLLPHPNPFIPDENPAIIEYKIPQPANVELTIYNVLGQKIRTIVNQYQIPRSYAYTWDGGGDSGVLVSSGVYFLRLKAGDEIKTGKILLVR